MLQIRSKYPNRFLLPSGTGWIEIMDQGTRLTKDDLDNYDVRFEDEGTIYTEWTDEFEKDLLIHRLKSATD